MPITEQLPPGIFRLSVRQYHDMVRSGILGEDDPVELLDGVLVLKMPKRPKHRIATKKVRDVLDRVVPSGWYVDSQEPVTLRGSEPEPDVAVIRGETDDYTDRNPGAEDVGMLVEVSDTSIERDREKSRIYAKARTLCYWIVKLTEQRLEVYSEPSGPTRKPEYRKREDYDRKQTVAVVLDSREVGRIAVQDLFPKTRR